MNSWIYKKDEKKNKKLYFRFHYITQHKIADMRNHWHFYFLHHIDSFAISFYCENQINKLFNILSKESWREIGASKTITEETDIEIRFAFYRLDRNVISQFFFFIFMYRSLTKCHFFSLLYMVNALTFYDTTRDFALIFRCESEIYPYTLNFISLCRFLMVFTCLALSVFSTIDEYEHQAIDILLKMEILVVIWFTMEFAAR